ncbi:C-type mannose receptor 2-like [Silurus meridionalis]|uniref:C-type mannose receptor 2-like n=1 Tax=Silurus meridionalis TaxID=175797 RepID=UPI001EEB58B2|nr:C-type mannose receptor 2-like [Silurus meridionalis]
MKLNVVLLLCLSGVVPITFSVQQTTHLFVINQAVSWPDAQKYCRTKYTDLARVKDPSVLVELNKMAASRGLTLWPLWIGLYNDFYNWRWSFNNISQTSTNLTLWNTGEPDNYVGHESCGGVYVAGNWADWDCALQKPFICYNAGNSGAARFIGVTNPRLNWSQAQTYCRTYYTDLASALTQADNDLLAQIVSVQGYSWFGLYRETWKWLNGTVASNLQWNPGKPNNAKPQENCGVLINGLFSDERCTSVHYFFCEFTPPVRWQIMKLQISMQSDGNVFEPVVQASILELTKQKLEQHGMLVNTKVTWRVQPDGNIFQKKINI